MSISSIRNTLVATAALFACLASSSSAFAGKHDAATVQSLWIDLSNGAPVYFIIMNGTPSQSLATCVNGLRRYATKDKSVYDLAMAAKLSGRIMTIQGAGVCRNWADSEDVAWVQFL